MGAFANSLQRGSCSQPGSFHVAVSQSNPKQICLEAPAFTNCTLGSEGQLEALEHISRDEFGKHPHQKMLSSLLRLARLLGVLAKVAAVKDGRV